MAHNTGNRFQSPQSLTTYSNDDYLLSPILPDFFRTIPKSSQLPHNHRLKVGLKNAGLFPDISIPSPHPLINPLSSLTPSVNLVRLDISHLSSVNRLEEDGFPGFVVQSEMIPKIREFHTSESPMLTTKSLHAKRQDGRPAFNTTDLRRLSIPFICSEDERNIRYLLENAKLLEKLHLSVGLGKSLAELHDNLFTSARTLKVLDLTLSLHYVSVPLALARNWKQWRDIISWKICPLKSWSFQVAVMKGIT